jgi:cyclohexanecarboxyl-CoA dehydrogenase
MDFTFTEEQEMLRAMVRDFVEKEVVPGFKERRKLQRLPVEQRMVEGQSRLLEHPDDLIKRAGELGLLGMNTPEEYGGNPQGAVTIGIVIEELSGYDIGISTSNSSVNFIKLASEEIKEEWLPAIVRGEKILNFGATEAEAGSDLRNAKTTARKDGKFWILNGEKNRVTGCYDSDGVVVLCRTDPAVPRLSPFLVTWDMPGVTRAYIDDIAPGLYAGIVSLEDVRVPEMYLLGTVGEGFYTAMRMFDGMRATMGLSCMRVAKLCLDETIEYVKQRVAFGRPIAKWEGVQFPIAEAATYIELGRWMSYRILWMQEQGMRTTMYSSMIKWWAPRTAEWIIRECMLLHGHYGYSQDMYFGDRLLGMNALGGQIGDGTAQIQKIVIARELMGKEFLPYR